MLKNLSRLEVKIGERVYQLFCDMDSPTVEIKEVCFQILKYMGQIEDQVKANMESQKELEENVKVEEISSEQESA